MFSVFDGPKQSEPGTYPCDFLQLTLLDPEPYGVLEAATMARTLRSFYSKKSVVDNKLPELLEHSSIQSLEHVYNMWTPFVRSCPVSEWSSLEPIMNLCEKCFRPCFRMNGSKFCMGDYCGVEMMYATTMCCGMEYRCRGCFEITEDSTVLSCGNSSCISFLVCIYRITSAYGFVFKWNYI